MATVTKANIKANFETGDQPTQAHFSDFIESSYNNYIDASNFNSLQNAVDSVSSGDVIVIYGQSFTVSSPITIPSGKDIVIVGLDAGNSTITSTSGNIFTLSDNSSLTIRNVTLNPSNIAIFIPSNDTITSLILDRVEFDGGTRHVSSDTGSAVNRLIVTGCSFTNAERGLFFLGIVSDAIVKDNIINGMSGSDAIGIWIGINTSSEQDQSKKIEISSNKITDIQCGSGEGKGILVLARQVIINNNQLENIRDGFGGNSSTNCEGIYTKMVTGVINSNTLVDSGTFEGSIICKGDLGSPTTAQADNILISSNIVVSENIVPDASIKAKGSSLHIIGNKCVGKVAYISTFNEGESIVVINDNICEGDNATGDVGIQVVNYNYATIVGNNIDRGSILFRAFDADVKGGVIDSNHIRPDGDGDNTDLAIRVLIQSDNAQRTIERVSIKNNIIEDGRFGIRIWIAPGAFQSLIKDVYIKNNEFYNITTPYNEVGPTNGSFERIFRLFNKGLDDAQSTEPRGTSEVNDIYLDDGTNTGDGNPKLRRYNGSTYEDL